MLQAIGPDVIYCDTDSVKFTGDHGAVIEKINARLKDMAERAGAYADNNEGERFYLGEWEEEPTMTRFKTLGSKKYLYETVKGIFSTIAGVNKKRGAEFFRKNGFEAFEIGTTIEDSGHLVAYRNDDYIHKITVKGCEMTTASNLALVDDTYTLGVTPKYLELLRALMENKYYYSKEGETS